MDMLLFSRMLLGFMQKVIGQSLWMTLLEEVWKEKQTFMASQLIPELCGSDTGEGREDFSSLSPAKTTLALVHHHMVHVVMVISSLAL